MKKFAIAMLALAACAAIGAGVVLAHHTVHHSQVTIRYKKGSGHIHDVFHGRVVSHVHKCEVARTVQVRKVEPGRDAQIGEAQTNPTSKWRIALAAPPTNGRYYSKAKRKVLIHSSNHRHVCKQAKSNNINVP